jgi:hypothetical protein
MALSETEILKSPVSKQNQMNVSCT